MSSTAVNEGPIVQNVTPTHTSPRAYGNLPPGVDDLFRTPEDELKEKQEQPPPGDTIEQQNARDLKARAINFAFAIGLLAWIFQWMFWAGFVYTSGQRFVCSLRSIIPAALSNIII
jgi:hypothetical protein